VCARLKPPSSLTFVREEFPPLLESVMFSQLHQEAHQDMQTPQSPKYFGTASFSVTVVCIVMSILHIRYESSCNFLTIEKY
jgi:hypothetical protein